MIEVINWVFLLLFCFFSVLVSRWIFRRNFPIPVKRWHMLRVFFWFEMAFTGAGIVNMSVFSILLVFIWKIEFFMRDGAIIVFQYFLISAWFWMLIPYAAYLQSLGHKQKGTEA